MTKLATTRSNRVDYIEFGAADTTDFARTKQFYRSAFGWSYKDWGNEYADTPDSGVASGINADPGHRPSHPLVVIYVDNLEAAQSQVLGNAGVVTREIFSFPGGRRFHFKDPAGNELAVWSEQ